MGFWHISQEHKNYNSPGMVTTQIFASLGIDFDSQQECFLATINNPRVGTQKISSVFSRYLRELPEEERTFRYFVTAANHEQNTTNHVLSWIAQPTEQGTFALNRGPSLVLEPGVVYTFYNDQHLELLSFKITLNEQNIVN